MAPAPTRPHMDPLHPYSRLGRLLGRLHAVGAARPFRHRERLDAAARAVTTIRLHGDLHLGNVLWREDGPLLVDFDDTCQGPAVQDLWMLLSGLPEEQARQLRTLLEGYETFRLFDPHELHLVEALRTARIMAHAAWIARRWDDPAFPTAFPWFATQRHWQHHVLALREQLAAMAEPPLALR